jgi:predicted cupin superfamily sugar epimerase
MPSAEIYIKELELLAHPEGGWYREAYRGETVLRADALPNTFGGDRNVSTAIYYLLEAGQSSHLHRIKSDEIWHFYAGEGLEVDCILADGSFKRIELGPDIAKGQQFQAVVPAGAWFGARPLPGSTFALAGCTVAPGFDFADFEMAKREDLLAQFPQHREVIEALTYP